MSPLRSPEDDAYRLLTENHTLLVLDTETTPSAGGGSQRLIQLGTVPVKFGRRGRPTTRLVDPGEPVTNSHIHGLTDADLQGQPGFTGIVAALDALLTGAPGDPPVVLVAHYANYDVEVLRGEYARLGRTLPDVSVLDTIALTSYVGHDSGRGASLRSLTASLGIDFVAEHHAGKDAEATAKVLVALLRLGARAGLVDLDHILTQVGSTTTDLAPPNLAKRPDPDIEPDLSEEHLATHSRLLAAEPSSDEIDTWLEAARECVQLRCPLARDRAAAAAENAPDQAAALLGALSEPAPTDLEPGQAGTYAGVLAELVPAALPRAGAGVRWWRTQRTAISALPRCSAGADRCPDCRTARPCPLDTLHQVVATTECGFTHDGHLASDTLNRLLQAGVGTLWTWSGRGDTDLAGYAAWLVIDYLESQGARARASGVLDGVIQLGLDRIEPRLALLQAQALLNQGRLAEIDAVLAGCSQPANNTDPGYTELTTWAAGPYAETLERLKPARPRKRDLPRHVRPEGRIRPNRFKR